MVGQRILDPFILVQIQVQQQARAHPRPRGLKIFKIPKFFSAQYYFLSFIEDCFALKRKSMPIRIRGLNNITPVISALKKNIAAI